jgi:hypothetical protein
MTCSRMSSLIRPSFVASGVESAVQEISRSNYRIQDFHPLGRGRIELQFINGQWVEIDFAQLISRGGSFAQLAQDDYLAQGQIGEYGHWMEWPGELDFGADQLWRWGVPARTAVAV